MQFLRYLGGVATFCPSNSRRIKQSRASEWSNQAIKDDFHWSRFLIPVTNASTGDMYVTTPWCRGRVWRLRTTLHEQLKCNHWISHVYSTQFTAYATPTQRLCSENYCTLFVWVLYYGFMDNKSYVGHWDGTDQSLIRIAASPLLVGSEMTFREVHDYPLLSSS